VEKEYHHVVCKGLAVVLVLCYITHVVTALHGVCFLTSIIWGERSTVFDDFIIDVVVSCALPTQGHVSSEGPAAAMETDALLLQVRGCGTVCQFIWDKL